MNPTRCVEMGDRLPDWVAARLPVNESAEVGEHVARCAECASQVAAIEAVLAARAEVPADLAGRIGAALRAADSAPPVRRRGWTPWAGSAAAVLVLVVGSFVLRAGGAGEPTGLGQVVTEESWIADDGMVAGAPVLDVLSDAALAALLEEMK